MDSASGNSVSGRVTGLSVQINHVGGDVHLRSAADHERILALYEELDIARRVAWMLAVRLAHLQDRGQR